MLRYFKKLFKGKIAEDYINEGTEFQRKSESKKAIEAFSKPIVFLDDKDVLKACAYFYRGLVKDDLGDKEGAIADYDKAIILNPNHSESPNLSDFFNCRGNAKNDIGDKEGAVADFTKAIEINPKFPFPHYNRGSRKADLGDYLGAIADFDKAISLNPDYKKAYFNRGLAKSKIGNQLEAIADYSRAVELEPRDYSAYYNRGTSFSALGQYFEAIDDYTIAIILKPDFLEAYNNRGGIMFQLGDNEGAISDFTQAIKLNPNESKPYNNIGNAKYALNDKRAAISYFTKAINLNPNYSKAYNNRGTSKEELGDLKEAYADFEKALKLDPNNSTISSNIARLKIKLGKNVTEQDEVEAQSFGLIYDLVKGWELEKRKAILEDIDKVYLDYIDKIKELAKVENNVEQLVHYTKIGVAKLFIEYEPPVRYRFYNSDYMNDGDEGKAIFNFLSETIIEAFNEGNNDDTASNFYIGSFMMGNAGHKNVDSWPMWNMYGKDENNRVACGCNIIIDANFFDLSRFNERMMVSNEKPNNNVLKDRLLSVFYYDEETKTFSLNNDEIKSLLEQLQETLIKLFDNYPNDKAILNKIIYYLISEIRFLFKSSQFEVEKELRVLEFAREPDDRIQLDENNKKFISSKQIIRDYIKGITLGCGIKNPDDYKELIDTMKEKCGREIEINKSKLNLKL